MKKVELINKHLNVLVIHKKRIKQQPNVSLLREWDNVGLFSIQDY